MTETHRGYMKVRNPETGDFDLFRPITSSDEVIVEKDTGKNLTEELLDLRNNSVVDGSTSMKGIVQTTHSYQSDDQRLVTTAKALKDGLATKQDSISLDNNFQGPAALSSVYPAGISEFYVTTEIGYSWGTAVGSTRNTFMISTHRSKYAGACVQIVTELAAGGAAEPKVQRQWKRTQRSTTEWQPFVQIVDSNDLLNYMPLAGGEMLGPSTRSYSAMRTYRDVFANRSGSLGVTGAAKIVLPVGWSNTMMTITIKGFNYAQNGATMYGAWQLVVSGYNYNGDSNPAQAGWRSTTAFLTGKAPFTSVQFGYDGTKCCLILGVPTDVWQFPSIIVDSVEASGLATDQFKTGWAIEYVSTMSGINVAAPNVQPTTVLVDKILGDVAGKQDFIRLADNYKTADATPSDYPNGVSFFKVAAGTVAPSWKTATGSTSDFGYVLTFRAGSGGFQMYFEMYNDSDMSTKATKFWVRVKRDSNSFWQPFQRTATFEDVNDAVYLSKVYKDTRSTNSPPSFYPHGLTQEFKIGSTVGIPDASEAFVALETRRPWVDSSGGLVHQRAHGSTTGKVYRRTGKPDETGWNSWVEEIHSGYPWQKYRLSQDNGANILSPHTDVNNLKTPGFYDGSNLTNMPTPDWYHIQVVAHSYDPTNWVRQTAHNFNNNLSYTRSCSAGTWSAWSQIGVLMPTSTAGAFDISNTAPTVTTRLNYNGYFYATRVYNAVYNDYAEFFEKDDDTLEPGDVVVANPDGDGYIKSRHAFDELVVGVFTDDYAQCIGGEGDGHDEENFVPVGMAGRVRVKVTGPVKKGQLLVSSDIPGVAMAGKEIGCILGKALEDHDGDTIDRIKALIMVG